jgi:hypothetical protein
MKERREVGMEVQRAESVSGRERGREGWRVAEREQGRKELQH